MDLLRGDSGEGGKGEVATAWKDRTFETFPCEGDRETALGLQGDSSQGTASSLGDAQKCSHTDGATQVTAKSACSRETATFTRSLRRCVNPAWIGKNPSINRGCISIVGLGIVFRIFVSISKKRALYFSLAINS